MPNRLDQEKSLYLKQHAHNPVDWYPWCEEAWARAKRENKPVLVSIGYAACHWCHVMAHECFEDAHIAKLMNEHFVCIKVDREERPEVDQLYMEAVQMITQRAGWPLNAFCLPDGRPFFGGTYFPPEDHNLGIIPWPQLLMRIASHYKEQAEELKDNADNIVRNLQFSNNPPSEGHDALTKEALTASAKSLCEMHDDAWGGFGEAPKFPPSMMLDFLLSVRATRACDEGDSTLATRIDALVNKTLTSIARGGIFDQIGGGFSRYSIDVAWTIPHFEKMLYDNALLIDIYTKAYARYQSPLYEAVVRETVAWLDRDMLARDGFYYAALDADSEGEEGRYYVWTPESVQKVLGDDRGAAWCQAYGISAEGNFEHGASNPTFHRGNFSEREKFAQDREALLAARSERIAPARDNKCLLAWNALLVRALSEAGFYFNEPTWLERARTLANWLWDTFQFDGGRLHNVYYDEAGPRGQGTLADYAYFIEANLALASKIDLLERGAFLLYVERARVLMDFVFKHFSDATFAGYFFTADDHEALAARKKEWFDNAIPSSNASLLHSLSALHSLTGEGRYAEHWAELSAAYAGFASRMPSGVAHALSAATQRAAGVLVLRVSQSANIERLRDGLSKVPWRRLFIQRSAQDDTGSAYQLCSGTECFLQTESLDELVAKI